LTASTTCQHGCALCKLVVADVRAVQSSFRAASRRPGYELRNVRDGAGSVLDDLPKRLRCSRSEVSRIEYLVEKAR
jgi:hypothetical protein